MPGVLKMSGIAGARVQTSGEGGMDAIATTGDGKVPLAEQDARLRLASMSATVAVKEEPVDASRTVRESC
jgi:hypothetical protein